MKSLLTISLVIITSAIAAQQTDTIITGSNQVYITDPRRQEHDLKKYTSVFVDSSNKLTIQEIASEKFSNLFQPLSDSIHLAHPYITYWLKLSLSASGDIQNWWLLLNEDPVNKDYRASNCFVDGWVLNNLNQVSEHQRTGSFVPRSQKMIKETPLLNRIFFSAKAGQTKNVYLRIYNEYNPALISSPQLRNPSIGMLKEDNTVMIAVSSCIFVFSILSFFFFFFMREKAYLFFGIYTLLLSSHYLILLPGTPFVNWFIPEHPHLVVAAFPLLAVGGWISFVLFGRFFINLPKLSRRLDTILKWVIGVWIICLTTVTIIIAVTRRESFEEINAIFLLLFIIFLIRISFFKSILVRFYVAGALWLVCFIILGILGVSTPFLNPFPIGQLGQILIYVAGLAYKMRLNEREKSEAIAVKVRNIELASLYEESNKQKVEIEIQKTNAEKALVELKAAQSQLIQSEKMASLGELTAGIAHEIQNPLNFVNNFSEVNTELIEELKNELKEGNNEEVMAIANDIKANEEKINHHGKRADAIVKGMLQHSRSTSATKEPTDINKLADEYLRLAYHGLRGKDKSFNATMKTDFDEGIGNINIIPQDIGRVLLNLYNNAFYAVSAKASAAADAASLPSPENIGTGTGGFSDSDKNDNPTIWVSTKKVGDKVLISVKDNGPGIPQKVIDKIFQPFFTTKPTGQGTGLGLSLAYDIIKAHGGEIKVESKEDEGSEFIIQLPLLHA